MRKGLEKRIEEVESANKKLGGDTLFLWKRKPVLKETGSNEKN